MILNIALVFLFILTCTDWFDSPPPPTDREMIEHFMAHENDFERARQIIQTFPRGSHYPPYNRNGKDPKDIGSYRDIDSRTIATLDSLMKEIKCEKIYYTGFEEDGYDPEYPSILFTYWGRGSALSGMDKDYWFAPHPHHFSQHSRPVPDSLLHKDSYEVVKENNYRDTVIFRPIKGKWFIDLTYDN